MSDYDAIVIGAGVGGLGIAALLAKKGRRVLLLEQSDRVGGFCSTFEKDGFHFDLGASIIEDVQIMNWLFQRLGTTLRNEVELIAPDPSFTVVLKDGTKMKYPLSIEESAKEIGKISPGDVNSWYAYCNYMKGFNEAVLSGFFAKPANTLADVFKMFAETPRMLNYMPLFNKNYQQVIRPFFKDEKIRESLSCQSFYAGLPPELAAGIYAVLPYSEHEGIYYSKGGMIAIPEALQRIGEQSGMKVKLNTLVKRVIINDHRAVGVILGDGTEITADLVISDINAKKLYLELIGEEHLPKLVRAGVKSYECSLSSPIMYLGIDYRPPLDSHHTMFTVPMDEMNDYWWNCYEAGRFPAEQFGLVSWTTHSDPNLAPKGYNILILTLMPGSYKLDGTT
jgi:diapolycopene oxygenase